MTKEETTIRWRDYMIRIDKDQYALYTVHTVKEGKTKGEEYHKERGYFSEPERMIRHMAKRETLLQHDTCTLDEFFNSLINHEKDIIKHISVGV
jgi:hypothetical protein